MKNPPRPTCHVCCVPTTGPVPNHRGGFFWLCQTCKGSNGRNITWGLDTGRCNNDPTVVAQASSLRGRCTSKRALIISRLVVRGVVANDNEGAEMVDAFGLDEVRTLVA